MLREDNGKADWCENSAEILHFPGIEEESDEAFPAIMQQGEVDGEIIRIGGASDTVPVTLMVDGRTISGCKAKRGIAKSLGKYLFEPVRLYGAGYWTRSPEGEWNLDRFNIERFDVLEDENLSTAILALRGLHKDKINGGILAEMMALRNENGESL